MTVSIWMRKEHVNTFSITKGLHVGFWTSDPGREDVVQVQISIQDYKNLTDKL
tara:strand:- start:69 stop:227 length:159 start_codon:yes stop_codon:yes gene_type:complete